MDNPSNRRAWFEEYAYLSKTLGQAGADLCRELEDEIAKWRAIIPAMHPLDARATTTAANRIEAILAKTTEDAKSPLTRYWVSWWSGLTGKEGMNPPTFDYWETGVLSQVGGRDRVAYCAVIDGDKQSVEDEIARSFPDYQMRFGESKPAGWQPPADRFPPHGGSDAAV